ncbi:MAG: glycosyltransferase family A protein [Patescibacteria group bacterium]
MISVIIATHNRPEKLKNCLQSIKQNEFNNYEVIVLDNYDKPSPSLWREIKKFPKTKLFFCKNKCKTQSLNYGVSKARGSILAFTDDDCVVTRNWLKGIQMEFLSHGRNNVYIGSTLPFNKTKKIGYFCPATFKRIKKSKFIKEIHQIMPIGFGNNFAIDKNNFVKLGKFVEWLGPGTMCHSGEDLELFIRSLENIHSIFRSQKMIVYHNNWIKNNNQTLMYFKYKIGAISCLLYSYYKYEQAIYKKIFSYYHLNSKKNLKAFLYMSIKKPRYFTIFLEEAITTIIPITVAVWQIFKLKIGLMRNY